MPALYNMSMIDASFSRPADAKTLVERGFNLVIYGDQRQFWAAQVSQAGFARNLPIDGETMGKQYGIETAAMVAAEGVRDDAYQEFVQETTLKLLDYAIKRKYLSLHSFLTVGTSLGVEDSR